MYECVCVCVWCINECAYTLIYLFYLREIMQQYLLFHQDRIRIAEEELQREKDNRW
jgi:hypothetical protein